MSSDEIFQESEADYIERILMLRGFDSIHSTKKPKPKKKPKTPKVS